MSLGPRRSPTRPLVSTSAVVTGLTLLATTLVAAPAGGAPADQEPPDSAAATAATVSPETTDTVVLQTLQTAGAADFAIEFSERADLSAASAMSDWDERGAWVADRLRSTAEKSQSAVRRMLDEAGVDYETFWIANTIVVKNASLDLAEDIIAVDDVGHLHDVPEFPVPSLREDDVTPQQADPVEWGIEAIGADRVWAETGVRGEEIVVAGIDTGVQFDHPALVGRYRGNDGDGSFDHDYNWFDPAGVCGTPNIPCDTQGHGTHTMGTAVGGQDGDGVGIGVAPGARWIAAKGCEAADGVACSLPSLLRSGEWTLEPTDRNGDNPRADLRPHIVNNSWGADTGPIADPFYDQIVRAWNASGIFAVFSNGNDGANGCRTVGSPADSPDAYGVGAYDENDDIAAFSSRGPAADGQVRPNIAAPGVGIRSALPRDRYAFGNGTSMAAPHVAGTVALLWSAAPGLIGDVHSTRELLDQTAVDAEDLSCGGTPENNNVFGEGRLDARGAVAAAPTGPTGTLAGLVTDAETGDAVPRVTVTATPVDETAPARRTTTDVDGRYSVVLPAGEYDVRFEVYGYRPGDGGTVAVAADDITTRDQALDRLPTVTLSGTVTDGSGHGWPLYAAVDIDGYPHGTIHTDPETGRYEVDLPADTTYSVLVTTPYEGYVQRTETIDVGPTDTAADVSLTVDAERHCPALGYEPTYAGRFETFDDGQRPDGWTVETSIGDGWTFANLDERGNNTGGSGEYAMVNSNSGARVENSTLTSPATDLSGATHPELAFRTELFRRLRSTASALVSFDGGQNWEVVWSRTSTFRGPQLVRIPLPQAAGESDVRVRFHYDGGNSSQEGLWQVDDVLLGEVTCTPVDGGLVVGQVRDDRTDTVVDGATVTVGDATTTTITTPADHDLVGGFFWLFAAAGDDTVTAENPLGQHHPSSVDVTVEPSRTIRADVSLGSGELVVDTSPEPMSTVLGASAETTVTVTNVGTAPASFELIERDAAMEVPDPHDSEWTRLADMRSARHRGLVGVNDDTLVYIGGSGDGAAPISQRNYTYSIRNDEWQLTDTFQEFRANPAGGFVDDLMYVIGGDGGTRGLQSTVLIYEPTTDTWTRGTDGPYGFLSAGHAIYQDRFYIFGGWNDDDIMDVASVYDPAADAWDSIAPYPEKVAGQMCGTVDGTIYCAGGVTRTRDGELQHIARAYGYRPDSDEWFRIPDLPLPVISAGYTAANGMLLISGGQVGGYRSNEGFFYDPAVGTWQDLPRSLFDLFNVGSGCGFYKVSGTQGRPGFFPWVEVLPGFDDCDTSGGDRVGWLSATAPASTVQPGESMTVTLRADTAGLDQPGSYGAHLMMLEDTPHRVVPLTVSLDVSAPDRWGTIAGTVTGLERCDAGSAPLEGATVRFVADGLDASVTTDADGAYAYHLPVQRGRLEVTVSAPGMVDESHVVRPVPDRTTTADFALRTDEPCAVADPGELSVEVRAGKSTTLPLTLSNADGAAPFAFTAVDTSAELGPLPGPTQQSVTTADDPQPAWTDATPVPGGRRAYGHAQCATEPNVTYMIGGQTAANPLTRRSWRYDAVTDAWTELAQIPATSASMRAVCEAGRIHTFVGDGVDRHFVYDIARDTWSEAAPLPRPVDFAAIAAWDGEVFVVGGTGDHDTYTTLDTVYVYDVTADEWSEGPTMPAAATHAGFAQRGHELYVVGGADMARAWGDWEIDVTQRLDLAAQTWSTGPSLLHARSELGAVATSDALYAIGGIGAGPYGRIPTTTVQRLSFDEWDGGAWRDDTVAQLPEPASFNVAGWCTTGRAGGEIWAAGGNRFVNRALYLPVPGETCVGLGPDASWVSLDVESGSVAAGDSQRLTVTVDATDLDAGRYAGTIVITTDDPGSPQIRVPVTAAITTKDTD